MASKKYVSFLSLLLLLSAASQAQLGSGSYDVQDSSVVPSKRLPQHTEFMANNYPYPAKPRNQWELGLQVGTFGISGDVRNRFPGLGAALHVRKALGYVFSLRGQLGFGTTKGLNFQPSTFFGKNDAWTNNGYVAGVDKVFYNYKTNVYDLSLQGVFTLTNIRFHKSKSSFNIYAFGGVGGMIYDTKIDAMKGNTSYAADFAAIVAKYGATADGFGYKNRKDIKSDLKDVLDGDYETQGQTDASQPKLFKKPFRFIANVGAGVQFKLNKKFSLAIEDKLTIPKTDLLDGQQWQENGMLGAGNQIATAQSRDYDTYNFLSVGINMALGNKAVEPLWWLNPLDYAYNEVNKPRHMKLPKPVLDDADGDGITDQFDQEPNTPAGAPVDSHGVSRDTDGDGVPDYKDKELVTPTQCQPVDADGVGKCPPPACCDSLSALIAKGVKGDCGIGDLPSVTFKAKSITLSNDAKALLASAATKIKENPNCKIAVIGYCSSSKSEQQLSWDRVNAVISYLVDKEGIGQDRFIFKYGETGGDCNTVDLRDGTNDEGPTTVPAPHPNLRRGR
jgi:outer membrane protein OmpA-like peptidoglycan-associated protein